MWTDRWTGTTIGAALGEAASHYGDGDAFIFGERHVGFRELEQVATVVTGMELEIRDPATGEALPPGGASEVCVAFVELKDGAAAGEQDLLDACRGGLASFKVPRQLHFVSEWPMSGTGKIQRFLLEEAAAQA